MKRSVNHTACIESLEQAAVYMEDGDLAAALTYIKLALQENLDAQAEAAEQAEQDAIVKAYSE